MTKYTTGNFVLPTASQYHNYEELPFMKDQATPHVAFPFVCGFTASQWLTVVPLHLIGKRLTSVSVCKMMGPMLKFDTKY